MPFYQINTNLPADKIPANFAKEASALVANTLGKPENYVAVQIASGQNMTFAGSAEPCAVCVLKSIGCVGGRVNNSHAEKLFKQLNDKLGIRKDRIYVEFIDVDASTFAYNGRTFG
ncbi:unnamed protein product [Dracunculus medinensis]|uniref:L-dopachrome isomerase n=1 Tax=Dracunculus medinensis TaxID=318479 RepID=A0A0N4UA64_DRAME|nr:unnamed protein product [Dracunculus medinensis]